LGTLIASGRYAAVGLSNLKDVGTFVHEIGHLLGLEDRYGKNGIGGVGVMFDSRSTFITRQDVFFIATPYITNRLNSSGIQSPDTGERSLKDFIDKVQK